MSKIKIFLLAIVAIIALPQTSSAYFTTEQNALKLNANTYLYTVTYRFGFTNRELRMPVSAVRGLVSATPAMKAGFVIQNSEQEVVAGGETSSIILSNAKVVNNEYYVPAGKVANFTLVTLLKVTPEMKEAEDTDLSLLVTAMPFTMIKEGKDIKASLNQSELKYYKTPQLDINN